MTFTRKTTILASLAAAALATTALAAGSDQHESHHAGPMHMAQAKPASPAMGMGGKQMPGYSEHMTSMQAMHEKMMAAKTAEERQALMAEQMKLMQGGMGMMSHMGQGAMGGQGGDLAARQAMMEQRMDMMQSMMQSMMDRMAPAPAKK